MRRITPGNLTTTVLRRLIDVMPYWRLRSLPLRFLFWPIPFVLGCLILMQLSAMPEYAGAEEVLKDGRTRRRRMPIREWWVQFMRTTLPELR